MKRKKQTINNSIYTTNYLISNYLLLMQDFNRQTNGATFSTKIITLPYKSLKHT